ncbi:MAG TPA: hypothetical protein G4O08_07400 [Anaerolineae bacterium]|nr:hypothetical protein [Anaerolineae bacterium]
MKPVDNHTRTNTKLRRQTMAFLLIILPSLGLYFAMASSCTFAVWILLALILTGMVLAVWKH